MVTSAPTACLLCQHPATITDWSPLTSWLAIEGCRCGSFFVWTALWDLRLRYLSDIERKHLSERIRLSGARGDVWISTADGVTQGPIVISGTRPTIGASGG